MPLRALLHGEPVVSTMLSDRSWLAAKAAVKADRHALLMPECGLPGRPWTSRRGLRYFRHQPNAARTCSAHEAESPEHLAAKAQVAAAAEAAGWQALVEEPGPGWVADVLAVRGVVRVALEVQWSSQTEERYRERQAGYAAAGVRAVWFARHGALSEPDPTLPIFGLSLRSEPAAEGSDTYEVELAGRVLLLADAVEALLGGRVKFRTRVGQREVPHRRTVEAYAYECWKCAVPMTVWRADKHPVTGACGLKVESRAELWTLWAEDRPEAAPDVQRAVLHLVASHDLPSAARLRHRRSRQVPRGYLAYCCPACGVMQGDWDFWSWLSGRVYEPPEGAVDLHSNGPVAIAGHRHWCLGNAAGHCPL